MPVLIEEHEIRLEWSDIHARRVRKKPARVEQRSTGVHLSGIIRHCLIEGGKYSAREIDDDEMPLRMAIGMAWEDWAVGLWPEMIWQPGEQQRDGVFGSPDGLTPGNSSPRVHRTGTLEEFKATWKSRRTYGNVIDQPLWMWQLAGYLAMMKLTKARMHILWVCGDYKLGPPSPAYVTYEVEFQPAEIERFWQHVVLRNKDSVVPEVH